MGGLLKPLERLGRRWLVALLARLLPAPRPGAPRALPAAPRVLVVRVDERVGNLVMLTALLTSVRRRLPRAEITVLGARRLEPLLRGHPSVARYLPYDRAAWWAASGPLRTPARLRRARFDLGLDGGNPTDPSVTQSILLRLSGASCTVGFDQPPFARLVQVAVAPRGGHEIELRNALLQVLPGGGAAADDRLPTLPQLGIAGELAGSAGVRRAPFALVNPGGRPTKRLGAADCAALCRWVRAAGLEVLLLHGPAEEDLARAVVRAAGDPGLQVAPPTTLPELAALARGAAAMVTSDTGPMHLAVAVGTPTCGLFVGTNPERYGYAALPHAAVDLRGRGLLAAEGAVREWLATVSRASVRYPSSAPP